MGITTLVLLPVADVFVAVANGKALWVVLLLLSLGLAAARWPSARQPAWLTPNCGPPFRQALPWP
ncbi:hypothetical protein PV755_42885 [Streptomyces caniscabiei]|uniref:hypothetical protein n=1 Tax=Streptomyces caniscabiei TaxID=2746961 RepID=UPI001CE1F234|nr:hypothetical protein [Streptomyces caniscabiei]MDX3515582.1 hypothetical protein [Streptomyces caniscabiei]MDX3724838.1 hypothetical protein [Streptomyces caniscabiei]MDX3733519.1 hypothetical protein [Streptomyces caniscabiei]WEO21746.1 hypothetical protein IHE65_00505 [Streptomyces caniscabiei]